MEAALLEVESHLGWTRERRAQIILRRDGGFGTTAVLNWLLSRAYQVVAKVSHSGRVRTLRQRIGPWQPTSSPGREIAAVLHPHRFCRTTRQWVIRTPPEKGGYHSGIQLKATQYPAWANHPWASWLVIAASASAMACSKASSVRAALARTSALTLDPHSSLGEKSGEYGGR